MRCQVSGVRCQVSLVMCCVSPVICHISLTQAATAMDPGIAQEEAEGQYRPVILKRPKNHHKTKSCAAFSANYLSKIANSETNVPS